MLSKINEAKVGLNNALPKKEHERVFMHKMAKDIWNSLVITHQGNMQVKDNKIDLFGQQYEQFSILDDKSIDSAFARFNTIITSLKALDESSSSRNHVRKFLRALLTRWRPKVTTIEESKDLSTLSLDELIGNLKVHGVVMEKDYEASKNKKERYKSLALKAKKESSYAETFTSGSDDDEYAMADAHTVLDVESVASDQLHDALSMIVGLSVTQVMSDSEDSTVTYTAVSSPFEDRSDIGSPRVDGPPIMPEDPYAYIVAAYQAPPSPDYMPGLEEPQSLPPLDFVPELMYPEYMPLEDEILSAEEQPLPEEILIRASRLKKMTDKGKKSSMETFAPNDKADYYSGITSITDHDKLRVVVFPISLAGALWDYWKIGGDEIEVSDDESSDLEEYWSDEEETAEIFKIETNVFRYEIPLCLEFNKFNYLIKVDSNLLTEDIMRFKTYKDYKDNWIYEWNKDIPWVDEKPWIDAGVWTKPKPVKHTCKPFNYKTGCSERPTYSWRKDGYCNGGKFPGAYHIGNSLYYQDLEWHEALEDSELKDEALKNKAIMKGLISDDESSNDYRKR
ncbi:hypothetical protein Tco_0489968 [Tanacetum coccineum]